MLIIDGPNLDLQTRLLRTLDRHADPDMGKHVSGPGRPRELKLLVTLAMCDHRRMIYHGFPRIGSLTRGERHMLAHALAAAGSMAVHCTTPTDPDLGQWFGLPTVLPTYTVTTATGLDLQAQGILKMWRHLQARAAPVWGFGSTGGLPGAAIMLVGDRVNPFIPLDLSRRQAFVSHHGSSLWLHETMAATGREGYYVTNAHKVEDRMANRRLLTDEIMVVAPRAIIGMGDEAQGYLSELEVPFLRTYHPQYWSRFKHKHTTEFIKLITAP